MNNSDPARQSLARPLTDAERSLADALEAVFATGEHDFENVVRELEARQIPRPSGATEKWSVAALEQELVAVNASLDAAYSPLPDGAG